MEEVRWWSLSWFDRTMSSAELALAPSYFSFGSVFDRWDLVPMIDVPS
jgi:hypothetical protein